MLPGVNVIYLRTDHKLIPIFFIINKTRERMYWDGSGKTSKLKQQFSTTVTTTTAHHDSNNLLVQPENLYTICRMPPEQ